MLKTVIIGLGNPVLTDDALGLKTVARLRPMLRDEVNIEITEAYTGGLGLMEQMVGFDRAIVIDAMSTRRHPPGTLVELTMNDLVSTRNTTSTHDTSLEIALEAGSLLGLKLPGKIYFYGIEAADTNDFGEELTPQVNNSIASLVNRVLSALAEEVTP